MIIWGLSRIFVVLLGVLPVCVLGSADGSASSSSSPSPRKHRRSSVLESGEMALPPSPMVRRRAASMLGTETPPSSPAVLRGVDASPQTPRRGEPSSPGSTARRRPSSESILKKIEAGIESDALKRNEGALAKLAEDEKRALERVSESHKLFFTAQEEYKILLIQLQDPHISSDTFCEILEKILVAEESRSDIPLPLIGSFR